MSHIESVEVRNIQSHKKTTLKLHSGVNAIVGVSDSGKSALFRALAWNITNKPSGDSLKSKWGGNPSVKFHFSDDTTVERSKVGKDNLYILDENEDDAFTAFKTDIPEAIYEALNMDEINLQTQMDAPFLLSASSGDVAKLLNRVANLTNIDTSLSNIRKKTQGVARDIANVKEQIEELEKEEKAFAYLEDMERDVEALNKIVDRWGEVSEDRKELADLLEAIGEAENDLDDVEILLSFEEQLEYALAICEQKKKLFQDALALESLITKIERLNKDLQKLPEFDHAEELLAAALELHEQKEAVRREKLALNSAIGMIRVQQTRLVNIEEEIAELEKKFHDEFPDQCPLCGELR